MILVGDIVAIGLLSYGLITANGDAFKYGWYVTGATWLLAAVNG